MPADAQPLIQPARRADVPVIHDMIMGLADNLGYAHAAVATEAVQDEWSVYRLKGAALRHLALEAD